jgi:glycosyltransferase involved in cell wall biosynthesis
MAERILYLLDNDATCREMGLIAQRESERFSGDQMVQNIASLYRELLID